MDIEAFARRVDDGVSALEEIAHELGVLSVAFRRRFAERDVATDEETDETSDEDIAFLARQVEASSGTPQDIAAGRLARAVLRRMGGGR